MKTCLVRVQDTHAGVGLFWFKTEEELSWMIDQIATPEACEYRIIGGGGVFFNNLPLPNPSDDDTLSDMRGYDEGLILELTADGVWHPCVSVDWTE